MNQHLKSKDLVELLKEYDSMLQGLCMVADAKLVKDAYLPEARKRIEKNFKDVDEGKLPLEMRETHCALVRKLEQFEDIGLGELRDDVVFLNKALVQALESLFYLPPVEEGSSSSSYYVFSKYKEHKYSGKGEDFQNRLGVPHHLKEGIRDSFFFIVCMLKAGPELGKIMPAGDCVYDQFEEGAELMHLFPPDAIEDRLHEALLGVSIKLRSLMDHYESLGSEAGYDDLMQELREESVGSLMSEDSKGQGSLPLREACNKIIHAKKVYFKYYHHPLSEVSSSRYANKRSWVGEDVFLEGTKQDKPWKVKIDIMAFIVKGLSLV